MTTPADAYMHQQQVELVLQSVQKKTGRALCDHIFHRAYGMRAVLLCSRTVRNSFHGMTMGDKYDHAR